jgi:hypothetical protein
LTIPMHIDFYRCQYYNLNMKQLNKLTYLGVVLVLLGFQLLIFIAGVGNATGSLVSVSAAAMGPSPVGAPGMLVFVPELVSVSAAAIPLPVGVAGMLVFVPELISASAAAIPLPMGVAGMLVFVPELISASAAAMGPSPVGAPGMLVFVPGLVSVI